MEEDGSSYLGDYAVDPDHVDFFVLSNALPLQEEEKVRKAFIFF